MKKYILLSLFVLITSRINATPTKFVDGSIVLATNLVNGVTYYSTADAAVAWSGIGSISSATVTVTTFTPSNFETNLSTCFNTAQTKFTSNSEFVNIQSKAALRDKMAAFRHVLTGYSFDTASPKYIDMAQRFDWIKSYYNSLP